MFSQPAYFGLTQVLRAYLAASDGGVTFPENGSLKGDQSLHATSLCL